MTAVKRRKVEEKESHWKQCDLSSVELIGCDNADDDCFLTNLTWQAHLEMCFIF